MSLVQNGMHSITRLSEACSDAVRHVRGEGISRSTNQQVLQAFYEKPRSGVQSGRVQIPTRLMSTSPSLPQCNGAKKPIILPVPSRQCPTRHPSHLHTQSGSPVRSQLMAVRMVHRWMRPQQNPGVMWRCIIKLVIQWCPKPPPMPCHFCYASQFGVNQQHSSYPGATATVLFQSQFPTCSF